MKHRAMKKALLSLALATGAMFSAKAQTIIYVDADATGSNNGSTWASAYTNLANALDNEIIKISVDKNKAFLITGMGLNKFFVLH